MSLASVTGHYELFHALFRKENDPADRERVKDVTDFISSQGDTIRKFLDEEELRLIGLIMTHWHDHREGVSRHELGEIVHRQDKSVGMTTILKVYDDYLKTFEGSYDTIRTMSVINRCLEDYRKLMFLAYANEAKAIVTGGVTPIQEKGKRGEPDRVGLKDARTFLMEKLQSPLFSNGRTDEGGWLEKIASDLGTVYKRDKARNNDHALMIPTGIPAFDKVLGGLERKTLNFVLGAAGARKSGLVRTMAYNAACKGNRVLFIPTEFSYEEELQVFAAMHAQTALYFDNTKETRGRFSVDKIHGTRLTDIDEKFLIDGIIPSMRDNLGDKLAIVQPASYSWPNIRSIIEMQNNKKPLDLIVLDYLGRLDIGDARDARVAYNRMADEVKNFLLYDLTNTRGGAAMVSPCHASRKGVADAVAAEGTFVKEAIFEYSQFEKCCDVIMYTFIDPVLQSKDMMKIGTCKSRRSADIPAQMVHVDPTTHRVGDTDKQMEKDMEKQREAQRQQEAEKAVKSTVSLEPELDDWVPIKTG